MAMHVIISYILSESVKFCSCCYERCPITKIVSLELAAVTPMYIQNTSAHFGSLVTADSELLGH